MKDVGIYGQVRVIGLGIAAVLVGMVIGGDGHQVASIVSHTLGLVARYPVFAIVLAIGIGIGVWIGRERAVTKLGDYEMEEYRYMIDVGGHHRPE